eukprot:5301442-Amphidinium_carterae.1
MRMRLPMLETLCMIHGGSFHGIVWYGEQRDIIIIQWRVSKTTPQEFGAVIESVRTTKRVECVSITVSHRIMANIGNNLLATGAASAW